MKAVYLALLFKPLGLAVIFAATWYCAAGVRRYMPEGRLKRILLIRL